MTISVIKAYQEDFDRVLPLLMEFDASRLGPTEWHRIFTSIWKSDIDYVGYMLVDEGNVVGFYGLLFSDHTIGGQRYTLCNFGNWIIKDGYRGHAIAMLLPLLRLTNITITNISASSNVRQIFQKLGFKEIRRKWLVLCPFFPPTGIFFSGYQPPIEIEGRLSGEMLQIYRDHCKLPGCSHFLFTSRGQPIYVLVTKITRKYIPLARIHYIGNPNFFFMGHGKIVRRICWEMAAVAAVIDERLLRGASLPYSIAWQPTSILYKSDILDPTPIGTIYSEEVVLA